MTRLLYVVTHPQSAGLLRGQLEIMQQSGYQVGLVSSPGPQLFEAAQREGVEAFPVRMSREIDPMADLQTLWALVRLMRQWQPDIVNAGTPKAGFLGMIAARIVGVRVRIYTLRGLRLESTTGLKRTVLSATERIASACAHRVIAVSQSLADRYLDLGLSTPEKIRVLGAGSSKGVDADRYANPDPASVAEARKQLALPEGAPVIGFVGRLTRDKGIVELVEAFDLVREHVPAAHLLLVGGFEAGDPVPEVVVQQIQKHPHIISAGHVSDTAAYYPLMDVLAFPSHREGFPNVPLEAAAAGLPVAGFRATGTVDAVMDGVTGTLVDIGDVQGLAAAITVYLEDKSLRQAHGQAGQERARTEFQPERIWSELLAEYDRLLVAAGRPRVNGDMAPDSLGA